MPCMTYWFWTGAAGLDCFGGGYRWRHELLANLTILNTHGYKHQNIFNSDISTVMSSIWISNFKAVGVVRVQEWFRHAQFFLEKRPWKRFSTNVLIRGEMDPLHKHKIMSVGYQAKQNLESRSQKLVYERDVFYQIHFWSLFLIQLFEIYIFTYQFGPLDPSTLQVHKKRNSNLGLVFANLCFCKKEWHHVRIRGKKLSWGTISIVMMRL